MVVYITIGQIPESSKSLFIYCGDYSSQETVEFNFCIKDNMLVGIDNDFSCAYKTDIFKPNSNVLNQLSDYLRLAGIALSANSIYNAVHLLMHDRDSFANKWRIVDSVDGGFQNQVLQYNGRIYLRRLVEKSEVIVEEKICVNLI